MEVVWPLREIGVAAGTAAGLVMVRSGPDIGFGGRVGMFPF